MRQSKYLVTAAAGKTGMHTVRHLIEGGHGVRALVYREDERSEALRKEGAEVVVGDLLEHDDAIRATQGISGAATISSTTRLTPTGCSRTCRMPQLIIYPDSNHGSLYQYPDLFLKDVTVFLNQPE
jgi:hypothetical protein